MLMNNWFECKVKIDKTLENGTQKKVTEPYLVDAMNFTDAEARIIKEITPYCNGQLEVVDIKRARYSEMFTDDRDSADKWYKAKVVFVTFDEKSETEKRTSTLMLVQAGSFKDALFTLEEGLKGGISDYEINTIQETNILDVFPYNSESESQSTTNDD